MLTVSDNHIVLGGGGGGGGGGDVVGAASSTDNAIVRWDSTTGKLVQNSNIIINDNGSIDAANGTLVLNTTTKTLSINNVVDAEGNRSYVQLATGNGAKSFFYVQQVGLSEDFVIRNYGTNGSNSGSIQLQTNGNIINMSSSGDLSIGVLTATAKLDVNGTSRFRSSTTFNGQIIDNVGSSGTDGQVLKKVGGLVIWANP